MIEKLGEEGFNRMQQGTSLQTCNFAERMLKVTVTFRSNALYNSDILILRTYFCFVFDLAVAKLIYSHRLLIDVQLFISKFRIDGLHLVNKCKPYV